MDGISLLGPLPPSKQQINQDEFDNRFNFVNRKEVRTCTGPLEWLTQKWKKRRLCCEGEVTDIFPSFKWINKYSLKTDLPKDVLGSLLIAALLLPHGLGSGFLALSDPLKGLHSLFLPQLLYVVFGSARHSSLGSITFVSLMVASSLQYSQSTVGTLMLISAIVHILMFVLNMKWLFCCVPDFLLNGVYVGFLIRLLYSQLPYFFVFDHSECLHFDWCLSSVIGCVSTLHMWTLLLGICTVGLLLLFHFVVNPFMVNKVGFSFPHELLLLLISIFFSFLCDFHSNGIAIFHKKLLYRSPQFSSPSLSPFSDSLVDSFSIALFAVTSHLKISKAIAMEKMQKIDRKQELLAFASIEFPSAFVGFIPVGSSPGLSQINVESARFSLMSNLLSCIWLMIFTVFCLPILQFVPIVVLSSIVVLSFPGVCSEIVHLPRLWRISKHDCIVFILGCLSIILIPNTCRGFLLAVFVALLSVVWRIQWPERTALVRLDGDGRFGEEERYEGEPCDAPCRVLRFHAPLIFTNVDRLRNEVSIQTKLIKGQVPLGIGTRTGSLRSQIEVRLSAPLEAKLSLVQSRTNLTNFLINDPQANQQLDQTLIRCLIIDFSAITAVDSHGLNVLNQIYFELQEENIKLLFAAVGAAVRDAMDVSGFFSLIPRNSFYPTLNDAVLATRAMILPIHTSVSMNGCRDVIALSNATSNIELTQVGVVAQKENEVKIEQV